MSHEPNAIMGIATMMRPTSADFRRAVIAQVYHAREMLWMVEKHSRDGASRPAIVHAASAVNALQACKELLVETDSGDDEARMAALADRAIASAKAAQANVERWQSYAEDHGGTKLETDMLTRQQPIWRRSAEEAKKEAHRLLALLCERWPDSYEKEDI